MNEIMFADGLVSDEMLEHYGTPRHSGRYPWGSGENPYHHGNSSPFGRMRERRAEKKKAKVRAAALEKARAARSEKAEYERKKAEALKSGSAQQIAPYMRDLSDNELRDLKNRLQLEAEFRQLAIKEEAAGNPKVALAVAKAERINKQANTAIDTYNNVARVYNAFSSEKELPIIGTKSNKQIKIDLQKVHEQEDQRRSASGKLREQWEQEKIKTKDAQREYDKKVKADKQAKKEAKAAKSESSSSSEKKTSSKAKVVDPIIEEIRDIEVVERPVESRSNRLLTNNQYLIEDKKKKKK